MKQWALWSVTILGAVAILAVVLVVVTNPHRGMDFDRNPEHTYNITTPDAGTRPYIDDRVQHPVTGQWITREQAEREAEIIEAYLCANGATEYC